MTDPLLGFSTTMETLTREQAARLLARLREAKAQCELTDNLLSYSTDWISPRTQDRGCQADAYLGLLERLLEIRAGETGRSPSLGLVTNDPVAMRHPAG